MNKSNPTFFTRLINKFKLSLLSFFNGEDFPLPGSKEYTDLESSDLSGAEFLILSFNKSYLISYSIT